VRYPIFVVAILALAGTPAFAGFTCTVSPKGDAVVVKADNPYPKATTCMVSCRFTVPGGTASVDCSQEIPGKAKDWHVCLRSTGGKAYKFEGGIMRCDKP
jgi:hypothetical protein